MWPKSFNNWARAMGAVAFLSVIAALPGCQSSCNRPGNKSDEKDSAANSADAAASINGVVIAKSELDTQAKRVSDQYTKTGRPLTEALSKSLRGSILRKMIDDEVIRQRAEKEGVKVDRIERVDALEKYKTKFGGEKGYQLFLEQQKLTEEQVQKTVEAELQRDKLLRKIGNLEEPTDQEIEGHYKANERLYTLPEMVRARHILLKVGPNEPEEKVAVVLKKAQQILAEAQQPEASFEALVQKYSEGPSVKAGGDLGFFQRGQMAKPFEDLAFKSPQKKAVGPVRTDFGFHIIYVEEKQEPKTASLDEVRDRVIEFLKRNKAARKSEEMLTTLRKEAKIVIADSSMTVEEYRHEAQRAQVTQQTVPANAQKKTDGGENNN